MKTQSPDLQTSMHQDILCIPCVDINCSNNDNGPIIQPSTITISTGKCTILPRRTTTTMNDYSPFRFPCKARNMSPDHNKDTAFIDIPVGAQHGLLLRCSHDKCRKSGRQFRYCVVCNLPVTKRNFMKRHAHGLVERTVDLPTVMDPIRVATTTTTSTSTTTSKRPAASASASADDINIGGYNNSASPAIVDLEPKETQEAPTALAFTEQSVTPPSPSTGSTEETLTRTKRTHDHAHLCQNERSRKRQGVCHGNTFEHNLNDATDVPSVSDVVFAYERPVIMESTPTTISTIEEKETAWGQPLEHASPTKSEAYSNDWPNEVWDASTSLHTPFPLEYVVLEDAESLFFPDDDITYSFETIFC